MKPLSEALMTKKNEFFVETFINILEGSNLFKDNIERMLSKLDMTMLKSINDYLKDRKEFLPYETNADEFLNNTNKDSIINKLVEFMIKFIVKN
jgi:hypothetical protein